MTKHDELARRLRACADDPMWADHAEVSKALLREAADVIGNPNYVWVRREIWEELTTGGDPVNPLRGQCQPAAEPTAPAAGGHSAAEVRQAYEDGRASMTHLLPEKPTRGVLMTVRSAVDLATGGQLNLHDSVIEIIYHNIRQATRLTAFHATPPPAPSDAVVDESGAWQLLREVSEFSRYVPTDLHWKHLLKRIDAALSAKEADRG